MYYKLPVKDRLDLIKQYKKAYPKMSYKEMVSHFNEGQKQYGDGGEIDKPKTSQELYGNKPQFNLTPQDQQKLFNPTQQQQQVNYQQDLERRKATVKAKPSRYNLNDYKAGIPEPGLEESVSPLDFLGPAEFKAAGKILAKGMKGHPGVTKASFLPSMGTKEVPKSEINWGQWNKEIPDNPQLIDEYNAIEQTSKANGSWMKNPDGSSFQGTPEQFVQQNSENFKKAFGNSKLLNPDGSPTIQYHGSAKKFDTFDESKFQLGDAGYSGSGIYTTPNKTKARSYSLSSKSIHKDGNLEPTIYELYGKGNNPISAEELIKQKKDYDLFNFHRAKDWQGDVPLERQMREYDVAIRNQTRGVERISPWNDADELVFPTNKQLKSATGNNGMFDMTNPNIYKGLIPAVGVAGAMQEENSNQKVNGGYIRKFADGGSINEVDPPVTLPTKAPNVYQAKDAKDYEYRKGMYNDSLALYKTSQKGLQILKENKALEDKKYMYKFKEADKKNSRAKEEYDSWLEYGDNAKNFKQYENSYKKNNNFYTTKLKEIDTSDDIFDPLHGVNIRSNKKLIKIPLQNNSKISPIESKFFNFPEISMTTVTGQIEKKSGSTTVNGKLTNSYNKTIDDSKKQSVSFQEPIRLNIYQKPKQPILPPKEDTVKQEVKPIIQQAPIIEQPQQDTLPKWNKGYYGQQPYGYITKNGKVVRGATREEWEENNN